MEKLTPERRSAICPHIHIVTLLPWKGNIQILARYLVHQFLQSRKQVSILLSPLTACPELWFPELLSLGFVNHGIHISSATIYVIMLNVWSISMIQITHDLMCFTYLMYVRNKMILCLQSLPYPLIFFWLSHYLLECFLNEQSLPKWVRS